MSQKTMHPSSKELIKTLILSYCLVISIVYFEQSVAFDLKRSFIQIEKFHFSNFCNPDFLVSRNFLKSFIHISFILNEQLSWGFGVLGFRGFGVLGFWGFIYTF